MKKTKSVKARSQQQRQQNGHPLTSKLASLLDPEASWDKVRSVLGANRGCIRVFFSLVKDQLGDVLHWMRQVLALACGLLWGAIPLGGATWIVVCEGHNSRENSSAHQRGLFVNKV
ncbi:Rab5-interacting protein (Rab5ip) [Musa troglodytarum]|uniref:Rab5-interacting protein (Rab5ip) n=1 Tax=Musa troglodytarum TaxID=320322 RepID=A0A9E7GDS5_9LILI|nr:Rab5-interacting protein (Rab5ip) [Musa troglodytarum]